MIFEQSVTRLRATERTGRAGDMTEDWREPSRELIDRLSVQPNTQNEDGGRTSRTYRVLSEPGRVPDVRADDRVEYRGVVHVIEGDVAFWPDPWGRDHVEFVIAEWKGA